MSRGAAHAGAPTPTLASRVTTACAAAPQDSAAPGPTLSPSGLETGTLSTRGAFHRFDARRFGRVRLARVYSWFAPARLAPVRPARALLFLVGEELPCRATALSLGSPRGSPRQENGRCYGLTSATDLTTRALVHRPIPMLAVTRDDRRPVRPRSRSSASSLARGAGPPRGNPAMGEHAFDDAHPASALLARGAPEGAAEHHTGAPVAAAFSTASEVCDSASDTRCHSPWEPRGRATRRTTSQSRFHLSLVKERSFPGSECLSSTGAPRTPLARTPRKPATDLAA